MSYAQSDEIKLESGESIFSTFSLIKGERGLISGIKIKDRIYQATEIEYILLSSGKRYSSQHIEGYLVEELVIGKLSLYRSNSIFYVQKINDIPREIRSRSNISRDDQGRYSKTRSSSYKGVLSLLTKDCLGRNDAFKVEFQERSLTEFVVKYNQCNSDNYQEIKENLKYFSISPSLGVGGTFHNYSLKLLEGSVNLNQISPSAMANFALYSPRTSEKLFLDIGILYSPFSASKNFRTENSQRNIQLKFDYISIPLSVRYSLSQRFGLSLGAAYDLFVNSNSIINEQTTNRNFEISNSFRENELNFDEYFLSIHFGFGYKFNLGKLSIESNVLYQKGSSFNNLLSEQGDEWSFDQFSTILNIRF